MSRNGTPRSARGYVPVIVLVAVLALLAGGLPVVLGGSGTPSRPGVAVQAPGPNGSGQSRHWWDPRGRFGGGCRRAPGAPGLGGNHGAGPPGGRPPGHGARRPRPPPPS